ncbi:uncharacterized protein LOC124295446 [Neodiprion lecontei]|uniref:Uncharacterized protein LOC124295446 n=1 Tax=Neodiprion lecontei TaxID=441921 RepID=A0ABM3GMC0_NEOLC|nr:uncharacterized protein LOC124295446 [Neodiprion lecontei]
MASEKILEEIKSFRLESSTNLKKLDEKFLEKLNDMKSEHAKEINVIKNDCNELKKEQNEIKEKMKALKGKINEEPAEGGWTGAGGSQRKEIEYLVNYAKRQENKDRANRRQNIIIKGLASTSNSNDSKKIESELLETKFNLRNAYSNLEVLGKDKNVYKITIRNSEDKSSIMLNKKTALNGTKIFVENDLTESQARERWNLRNAVKPSREAGSSVRFYQNKVNVDGSWLAWDEGSQELIPTHPPNNNKIHQGKKITMMDHQ